MTSLLSGSALAALGRARADIGGKSLRTLMAAVDEYIPQPTRALDQPFLMPIEDVFSISGRGTVVTGRIERGIVNVGEEIEIVGSVRLRRRLVLVLKCSASCLDRGEAGDNVGVFFVVSTVKVLSAARSCKPVVNRTPGFEAEAYSD